MIPTITLQCSQCGTSFERPAYDVKKKLKHRDQHNFFCSMTCFYQSRRSDHFYIEDEPYQEQIVPQKPKRFNTWWRLTGDFLIINDLHIPATDWGFAGLAVDIAKRHLPRPRHLLIDGDFLDFESVSKWDKLIVPTPLYDELEFARSYLNYLAEVFDDVWIIRGNHEDRFLKKFAGDVGAEPFVHMLTRHDRIHFSMYAYCTVTSGGETFRVSHQRNYSRNPLTVGRRLSNNHGTHVICGHQHHSAVGRNEANTKTIIDSGGLFDRELMAYCSLDDSTSPIMSQGFVLLKGGIATLFTPPDYKQLDYSKWGIDI